MVMNYTGHSPCILSNSTVILRLRIVFLKTAGDLANLSDVDSLPHNLEPK